jgi:hypothetical protein
MWTTITENRGKAAAWFDDERGVNERKMLLDIAPTSRISLFLLP